ncbi:arylsulfatase B-like isoform X2 [Toxorhynchites rutilus septentrionalis]|uniref:arylsulfatase B-like isoform X2 n=1 Tax=Toxorhynchites rutilus septentrionalis TaxID=329112 RepID=UPI0024790BB8|nr:arylsulfatase B-like isoform X2 [Toxorhynchites rutilus septentrionalis]
METARTLFWACTILLTQSIIRGNTIEHAQRPHIIIIMADDMGIDDVSFHGSNQILTPNIDALGYDGIILNRHYTAPMCTPSRAALMTGRNPISTGMQHFVIDSDEPWGLGLDQKIMPEYFREAGYRTHLVGKWHLGFFTKQYTPTMRGFDTHTGYLGPFIDYWNSTSKMPYRGYAGYDMRQNLEVDFNTSGTYITDHFTDAASSIILKHKPEEPLFLMVNHLAPHAGNDDDPLQAPDEVVQRFKHVFDGDRRTYAAMVSKLDDSVGQIYKTLQSKNMLQNSIILFMSDNGAPAVGLHTNSGSNQPLRGQKNSPWEGATRNAAVIWSPLLRERQRVSNQFIHISDWLPTLASAANVPYPLYDLGIDGIDQWEALSYDTGSPRKVVLNMIDEIFGYSSYMQDGFKYVNGTTLNGNYDEWFKQSSVNDTSLTDEEYIGMVMETEIIQSSTELLSKDLIKHLRRHARINCGRRPAETNDCNPLIRPCLFDVINDPCELNDISHKYPGKLQELAAIVELYRSKAVKPRNKPADPAANPANFGGIWTWWMNDDDLFYDQATPPPTQTSLPESIQLIVIITILVVGTLFVIVALIYLSNKNLLRIFRSNKMISTKESAESQAGSQSSMPECDLNRESAKELDISTNRISL